MALLSDVAKIAGRRNMQVYGFTHLCRRHHVSYGQPEDFFALPSVLREHRDFRSGIFRFAAATMSGDQPMSLNEVAVALAVALGGLQIAAQHQLEVPDELMAMLRCLPTPGEGEVAADAGASGPVPTPPAPLPHPSLSPNQSSAAEQATPVPVPTPAAAPERISTVAGTEPPGQRLHPRPATVTPIEIPTRHAPALPFAQSRSAEPQAASGSSRRPPILGQTLRAEVPEDEFDNQPDPVRPAPSGARPELVAKVKLLATERRALQQQMQEVEERLTDVIQELGLVEPASTEAHPESGAQVEPQVRTESYPAPAAVPTEQLASVALAARPIPHPNQLPPVTFKLYEQAPPTRAPRDAREAVGSVSQQPPLVHGLPHDEASIPSAVPPFPPRSSWLGWWSIGLAVFFVLLLAVFFSVRHLAKPHFTAPRPGQTAGPQTAPDSPVLSRAAKPSAGLSVPAAHGQAPQREIDDTLQRWASAAADNDPVAESAFYAPSVDRYFLRRNVSRGYVLADKQAFRARGNTVGTFTISQVKTQLLSPSSAVVNLRKTWSVSRSNAEGPLNYTWSRLWLRRGAQGWWITGEQDLTSAR